MQYRAENAPLQHLDEWDEFVTTRYREGKSEEEFRNYKADANPTVTEFYRQNHAHQTLDFVLKEKAEYCGLRRGKKSIWEMAEYLNTLVDGSDPDTDLRDRKSTRLNSSHGYISYAVFCLKKKKHMVKSTQTYDDSFVIRETTRTAPCVPSAHLMTSAVAPITSATLLVQMLPASHS